MKLPRAIPVAFDLIGLAWDITKAIARMVKPEKRGLSHADSERQARAAREAGPPCGERRGNAVCFLHRGHEGPHWFIEREAGG